MVFFDRGKNLYWLKSKNTYTIFFFQTAQWSYTYHSKLLNSSYNMISTFAPILTYMKNKGYEYVIQIELEL